MGPLHSFARELGIKLERVKSILDVVGKKRKEKSPILSSNFQKQIVPLARGCLLIVDLCHAFCCWRTVMDGVLDSMRKTMCSCKRCQCPWYCSIVDQQHDSWEEGAIGVEPWSWSMVAILIWRSLFFLLAKFVKKRTSKLKFQI